MATFKVTYGSSGKALGDAAASVLQITRDQEDREMAIEQRAVEVDQAQQRIDIAKQRSVDYRNNQQVLREQDDRRAKFRVDQFEADLSQEEYDRDMQAQETQTAWNEDNARVLDWLGAGTDRAREYEALEPGSIEQNQVRMDYADAMAEEQDARATVSSDAMASQMAEYGGDGMIVDLERLQKVKAEGTTEDYIEAVAQVFKPFQKRRTATRAGEQQVELWRGGLEFAGLGDPNAPAYRAVVAEIDAYEATIQVDPESGDLSGMADSIRGQVDINHIKESLAAAKQRAEVAEQAGQRASAALERLGEVRAVLGLPEFTGMPNQAGDLPAVPLSDLKATPVQKAEAIGRMQEVAALYDESNSPTMPEYNAYMLQVWASKGGIAFADSAEMHEFIAKYTAAEETENPLPPRRVKMGLFSSGMRNGGGLPDPDKLRAILGKDDQ